MLLGSTSCGIDVQVATQCQSSSALGATASRLGPASSGVGMAEVGDNSNNEATIAAQRGRDNMTGSHSKGLASLGCESGGTDPSKEATSRVGFVHTKVVSSADVQCPKVDFG